VTILASLIIAIIVFFVLGGLLPLVVRLLISLSVGALTGSVVLAYFRRIRAEAALPEKKAILASAHMVEFSWRATTFEFENEAFFDKFVELNRTELMES
jgi:hypothetical protein